MDRTSILTINQWFICASEIHSVFYSLLIQAVVNEDKPKIEFLLDKGADPSLQDLYGVSPMDHASKVDDTEIVDLLKEAKISHDAKEAMENGPVSN